MQYTLRWESIYIAMNRKNGMAELLKF